MTEPQVRVAERSLILPPARGVWTASLYALLGGGANQSPEVELALQGDVLGDDDFQMALYLCYELHYAAIEGVDDRHEWNPLILMFRAALEEHFEAALRLVAGTESCSGGSVGEELQRLVRETIPRRSRATSRRGLLTRRSSSMSCTDRPISSRKLTPIPGRFRG
jgi:hypothetical protein